MVNFPTPDYYRVDPTPANLKTSGVVEIYKSRFERSLDFHFKLGYFLKYVSIQHDKLVKLFFPSFDTVVPKMGGSLVSFPQSPLPMNNSFVPFFDCGLTVVVPKEDKVTRDDWLGTGVTEVYQNGMYPGGFYDCKLNNNGFKPNVMFPVN
jgi:hypothetical protein